jgi:hypothetical protein
MGASETPLWRRLLDGWMVITGRFGAVQTLVVLAGFYVFLLGPVSLVQALGRSDLLDRRNLRQDGSAWRDADTGGADLERAKLQS